MNIHYVYFMHIYYHSYINQIISTNVWYISIFLGDEIMAEHQPMLNAATPAESMDTVLDLLVIVPVCLSIELSFNVISHNILVYVFWIIDLSGGNYECVDGIGPFIFKYDSCFTFKHHSCFHFHIFYAFPSIQWR